MSEQKMSCRRRICSTGTALFALSFANLALAGIDGTGARGIDGTGLRGIDGTGLRGIDGTGLRGIDGTGAHGIDGTGLRGIDGTGLHGIDGTGAQGIDGTGLHGIDGTGLRGIDGTGAHGIDGTGLRGIDGTGRLLVVGHVEFVGDEFASILGQSVFFDATKARRLSVGDRVAVYGVLDSFSGGIVNPSIVTLTSSDDSSLLTGVVDEVDHMLGTAVVSGVSVNYTALLGSVRSPEVGQVISIAGRHYKGVGLVAEK